MNELGDLGFLVRVKAVEVEWAVAEPAQQHKPLVLNH